MHILSAVFGAFLVISILWEGFETIVLPRSVTRPLRLTRQYYRLTWPLWRRWGLRLPPSSARQQWMGIYGPLSLPVLLTLWAMLLITGFAMVQWSQGYAFHSPSGHFTFGTAFYQSGVTFFTLGYGDVVPFTSLARGVAILECGVGFGFLAVVIGYLPVLYQAFSRREATISRLDARASSPATAGELLLRYGQAGAFASLERYLQEWEQWASEILESHLSYPVLTYYRSQHEHQSWLGALMMIMDLCALIIVGLNDRPLWQPGLQWQAELTFAMARHALIDLAYTLNSPPLTVDFDRLPADMLSRLRARLAGIGLPLRDSQDDDVKLSRLREMYEPYFFALGQYLAFPLPAWNNEGETTDNWQTSAWDHTRSHF